MAIKKRDFQKTAGLIQEFLSKLSCEESTAELRDSMHLVLFYLQKYYKKLRSRSLSNGTSPKFNGKSQSGSLVLHGGVSPLSPACGIPDQFEWKWYNLESPRLSASLGTNEFSSLPLVLQAAKSADSELLRELIAKDSEVVNQVDGLGRTAAMYCVHGNTPGHTECLEILISADCDLDFKANDNTTALHVAAYINNTAALPLLLRNKAPHNAEDNQGRTPLHWAAANPSEGNLKLLLQVGGKLDATDSEGLTPAMWACYFDQLCNLQLLQNALARIDPEEDAILRDSDRCGQTVIHWAVKGVGSLECLEALLTPHSAVLRDNEGKTVLHTAAEKGIAAACEMILEVRGNLEGLKDTDNSKRTAAHLAAICGQAEVVNFLLERGGDLLVKDCFGATAVDYIHNKQLNYCEMVIRAHSQHSDKITGKIAFVPTSSSPESPNVDRVHSRPLPPKDETIVTEEEPHKLSVGEENCDVSDLHGFEVQGGSGHLEDSAMNKASHEGKEKLSDPETKDFDKVDNRIEQKRLSNPKRRQSTLTRQNKFHHDGDSRHLMDEATSFDLRTEDGDILVVVSNLDTEDQQEEIVDMEDGDVEIDHEEKLEYSSACLQQGRGSASSIYSEPDNADNCSVSVGLSVSSLGSDNEDIVRDDDLTDYQEEDKEKKHWLKEARDSQPQFIPESHKDTRKTVTTSKHPPKLAQLNYVQAENTHINSTHDINAEGSQENLAVPSKKKKDKAKKKKPRGQSELTSPLPPPRGSVLPLSSASLGPPGITKLSTLDPRGIKPAPWEHGSLGTLRQAPLELLPTSPRTGRCPEGLALESAFERPRTPEAPRSPRDTPYYAPQSYPSGSMQGNQDASLRGSLEGMVHDRDKNYGPPGPLHGPLAHANGQALLRNMDITGRGPKMESHADLNMGRVMPHRPTGQQTYSLRGPIPHPPQH